MNFVKIMDFRIAFWNRS